MMNRWAFGQSTPSMQAAFGSIKPRKKRGSKKRAALRAAKKRKSSSRASKIAKVSKRRRSSKPGKLKKGSAAAKAYMAKIRKMRK